MKPVKTTMIHDPENNQYGDCYRACLASLLHLDTKDVPHFSHPDCEVDKQEWLAIYGVSEVNIPILHDSVMSLNRVLFLANYHTAGRCYYLLTGESTKGINHSVVCKGPHVVHNPSYAIIDKPIKDDSENSYWWISFLAKL